jgi:hypothetical protein
MTHSIQSLQNVDSETTVQAYVNLSHQDIYSITLNNKETTVQAYVNLSH